jgi:hypothetical protein F3_00617|nr:MAG TPA: hypothetical protein [Caudoviricetes sp.]
MKELTKEELLRQVELKEYTIIRTNRYGRVTNTFKITENNEGVNLEISSLAQLSYLGSDETYTFSVGIKGNNEEYSNSIYGSSDVQNVYEFLHELKLNFYGVIKSFDNGIKTDNKNYNSTIVPFEFREAQTLKLYKIVDREDLDKILKEGILPISKTGNDNWENNRRADNSIEVVYLFKPLTEQLNFSQYGDVLLEVETTAYKNEILPYDRNRGKYEEFITYEVKPEEIKGVKYLNE